MKNFKEYLSVCAELVGETAAHIASAWQARNTPFKFQKQDGAIIITGYKGSLIPKAVIPSEICGLPVKTVGARSFLQCPFLEEIHILDGAEIIEANAFSSCDHLTKVFMKDSVREIGKNVFFECENLYCVELSPALQKIENRAFYGCKGLRDIDIPDGVEYIGDQAFYGCKKLKSIRMPLALKHLPRSAFDNCPALEHIYVERGSYADRVLSDSPHFSGKLRYIPRI
ncbi:MAG: leucine-rich repeat domain-containing protein [Clostridia bacterium]|nr:leucine-rich repeat domain-containing protein [Clostridia bacterium]